MGNIASASDLWDKTKVYFDELDSSGCFIYKGDRWQYFRSLDSKGHPYDNGMLEVLSVSVPTGVVVYKGIPNFHSLVYDSSIGWSFNPSIHSVKRLSDGVIFTLGDIVSAIDGRFTGREIQYFTNDKNDIKVALRGIGSEYNTSVYGIEKSA